MRLEVKGKALAMRLSQNRNEGWMWKKDSETYWKPCDKAKDNSTVLMGGFDHGESVTMKFFPRPMWAKILSVIAITGFLLYGIGVIINYKVCKV